METKLKEKYAGTGIRMHQLAIEKSKEAGFGGEVNLNASYASHGFHYKLGYRPHDGWTPYFPSAELDDYRRNLKQAAKVGLNINDFVKIKDDMVSINDHKMNMETMMRNNIIENPDQRLNIGSFKMKLDGKRLGEWLEKISSQPLLNSSDE